VAARQDERGRENNCFPVEEGLPTGRNGKTVGDQFHFVGIPTLLK